MREADTRAWGWCSTLGGKRPRRARRHNAANPDTLSRYTGHKRYEVANHLGNVLAVLTDRKHGRAASGSDIQWFEADVVASQQYYPFGMLMPGHASDAALRRQYVLNGNDYRYGFNGKEGDDEVKGDDNQQDYGMRIYDPRAGRFLSVDPIAREYPELSTYQFASNTPIQAIDMDGLEAMLVFDKYYRSLHIIPDLSQTKSALEYKYVSALEYSKLTVEDKAKYNYGIVVNNRVGAL